MDDRVYAVCRPLNISVLFIQIIIANLVKRFNTFVSGIHLLVSWLSSTASSSSLLLVL